MRGHPLWPQPVDPQAQIGFWHVETPPWMRQAACIDQDMYPDWVDSSLPVNALTPAHRRALKFCDSCTVRSDCLRFALETSERHGIWGGTIDLDRAAVLPALRAGRITVQQAGELATNKTWNRRRS